MPMKRISVVELKNSIGEVLNQAEYQGERTVIHRRGKDAAALVSIEDLKLLEKLIEEAEDRIDNEAADRALAESDERTPFEDFCRRHGLDDGPKTKPRPRAKSGTPAV